MANLQKYSDVKVYVDGTLLAQHTSVTIKRMSGAQRVFTVVNGFAGLSPGSPVLEATIENGIPSDDFELNPGQAIKFLEIVEVTFVCAGKQLTARGFFEEDSTQHSVNSPSSLSFSFVGKLDSDWQ